MAQLPNLFVIDFVCLSYALVLSTITLLFSSLLGRILRCVAYLVNVIYVFYWTSDVHMVSVCSSCNLLEVCSAVCYVTLNRLCIDLLLDFVTEMS